MPRVSSSVESRLERVELARARSRAAELGRGGTLAALRCASASVASTARARVSRGLDAAAFRLDAAASAVAHRRELGLERARCVARPAAACAGLLGRPAARPRPAAGEPSRLGLTGRLGAGGPRPAPRPGPGSPPAASPSSASASASARSASRERGLEVEVAGRDGRGQRPPLAASVGLGRRALATQARPVALDAPRARTSSRPSRSCSSRSRPRARVVRLASLALERRPARRARRRRRAADFGGRQLGHRRIDVGPRRARRRRRRAAAGRPPRASGRARPASSAVGELVAGGAPRRLLLGLGGQPARLRPELGEDVLDAREVRLGLGELLLGLAPAALVAADAGDLLEQRPALLGPERQRLVDHALADEQEGVVGEVGGVEQVDEVAQPDPLAVEQVLVLARAIQPAAELDDAVVDRQQAVGVVEDERDVGHAEGRPLLGAGPDDVLGLARAERAALLAERPAQRVGEVALARAVRPDDRADARPELDDGPLGEGLEALEPEASRRGSAATLELARLTRRRSLRSASASGPRTAAQVLERLGGRRGLGDRRDGPRRRPSTSPSTSTSIRKCFSWSGPVASTRRYVGRPPVVRWVCSWSRLLGLLSVADRRVGLDLRRASVDAASRGGARSRGRGRARRRGLEGRGEERGPATPAARGLALAEQESGRGRAGWRGGPGRGRHDRRAARGEHALVVVGMARVERLGDGEVHDGVAQELEAFVVAARRRGARAASCCG